MEAQAMTTSKWDLLEASHDNNSQDSSLNANDQDSPIDYGDTRSIFNVIESTDINYINYRNMSEERRMKLREIEVKAVQYQDELESGQRTLKVGWTVSQQVEHYRRKLLRKAEKESKKEPKGDKTPKPEKHKRDYDKSERRGEDNSDDEYYKEQ